MPRVPLKAAWKNVHEKLAWQKNKINKYARTNHLDKYFSAEIEDDQLIFVNTSLGNLRRLALKITNINID